MFDELHHADWSTGASKRWVASAWRTSAGWVVVGPRRVGRSDLFVDALIDTGRSRRVLAGFDFSIGLPLAYGLLTEFSGFREALPALGHKPGWEDFFNVSAQSDDVTFRRPFYPRTATKGVSRSTLTSGIGVASFSDLLRQCERGGPGRREACSVFWTLGGNQVGRAATSGWQEVVRPALAQGATLWPFDGDLRALSARSGLVLAETYPADAYFILGAPFGRRESKTSQADRRSKAASIIAWSSAAGVDLGEAREPLLDGFGASSSGEDPFDALAGLLAMIEVVEKRAPEAVTQVGLEVAAWEGWIVGR
ncbi:DUF429 domain-containing protein [Methylobacterium sp. WL30]|uniref:DUF429 domain-containing protein n=1 Tax=unclassified Methylobacterium TaxID=2615210 RepID=UPI0011CBFE13|nr:MULTISPECIES: DUF429 domain-containing protein [unclassified Methylobacterium]TXN41813.1 DUF429 domain-containing protein [Methylobacterium sp. WL93]TXN51874.1 DUF429 domain-containing protein [Methylobacterium sp. WL119]TXN68863.1 DUF429 domain-containing protein [Methylobacterium sp. WL30]